MNPMLSKPLIKFGWLRALVYFVVATALVLTVPNYALLVAAVLLVTYLFRVYLDGESFLSLGFKWRGFTNEATLGFCSATAILGLGTIVLFFAGYLTFIGIAFDQAMLVEIPFLIGVAFVEEMVFRGYLLNNLMKSVNKWSALGITALMFALAHSQNPSANILPVINVFAAGILLGLNYIYTNNLWFSILFHFAWNFLQGPVLGYEVSGLQMNSLLQQNVDGPNLFTGGAFGFEGSVICFALITLFVVWFYFSFNRKYSTYL